MTRKPIPPRVAPPKKQVPQEQLVKELKARNTIRPQTFKEAQARELVILPPTFTEKNLQTKKVPEEKVPSARRPKQASEKAYTTTESNKRAKKKAIDLEAVRETKHSGDQSAGFSDKNTIDSQREQTENREELLHHTPKSAERSSTRTN